MFARGSRVLAVVMCVASAAVAVPASAQQFESGAWYGGPRIWIGNLNGATAIGGQVEKGITKPGEFGPGIMALGVGVDFYHWSSPFVGNGRFSYSVIPLQGFGNYHFIITDNKKFDPFIGLALVYSVYNASCNGFCGAATSSSLDFAGQAGLRYFLTDKFALQGQLGFGYGTLGLGATWKF